MPLVLTLLESDSASCIMFSGFQASSKFKVDTAVIKFLPKIFVFFHNDMNYCMILLSCMVQHDVFSKQAWRFLFYSSSVR